MKLVKHKKQVVVGKQKYINEVTGEVEEFSVIEKPVERDFNFHKVWLQDILAVLDSFGTARLKVLTYLLKSMRSEDNTVSGSYREIASDLGVSYPVVAATMKELIESNVLKKVRSATYQFNPDLIVKGAHDKRKNLLIKYKYSDEIKTSVKEVNEAIDGVAERLEPQQELDFKE